MVRRRELVKSTKGITRQVHFPADLDFANNSEECCAFLEDVNQAFFFDTASEVTVDHKEIARITPESVLVLISTFTRATCYSPNCRLTARFPADPDPRIMDILGQAGYLEFYRKSWKKEDDSIQLLHHYSDHRTKPEVAATLTEHFEGIRISNPTVPKALGRALIECMENTIQHAYPPAKRSRKQRDLDLKLDRPLVRQWWTLGYRDLDSKEISFCFCDQGVGIPATIRTRLRDLKLPIIGESDEDVIVKAVRDGHYSRTKEPSRGRGLPTLLRFVETAEQGELTILSNKSKCQFRTGQQAKTKKMAAKIPGTLIVWKIRIKDE